jgi:hypothetical protein
VFQFGVSLFVCLLFNINSCVRFILSCAWIHTDCPVRGDVKGRGFGKKLETKR